MESPVTTTPYAVPFRLESPSGLSVRINANGSLRRMDHGDIILNLFPGNETEGGPANLYLRRLAEPADFLPLLGPANPARLSADGRQATIRGEWRGIRYTVTLLLAESAPAWVWQVALENPTGEPATLDLIYAHDLGLAHYGAVRLNEYYVSQYLDHTPLSHPLRGTVLATRQNQSMGGRHPWCVIGSLVQGVSFATDALQVHGLRSRVGQPPQAIAAGLPGFRHQHEHAMAAIQDAPLRLAPGEKALRGFFGWFEADHPAATSDADLACVDRAMALPESARVVPRDLPNETLTAASLFGKAPLLEALPLADVEIDALFGAARREEERDEGRRLASFFAGTRSHVVLRSKELNVLRPHGHILRSGSGLVADEAGLASTAWMGGVFHSMVTQGHVSINRFLSTTHGYLGLFRSHGLRIFVELAQGWTLLDQPSAFEMQPEACRWLYKTADGLIEVRSAALTERHELTLSLKILAGAPLRCLVSCHVALNGDDGSVDLPAQYEREGNRVFVRAVPDSDVGRRFPDGGFRIAAQPGTEFERVGGDELLFIDGLSRNQPFLCLVAAPAMAIGFSLTGHLLPVADAPGKTADDYWREVTAGLRIAPLDTLTIAPDAQRFADILPWFAHNALIHYLAPRGLEQYSGGGWGTRDVTQGPVEMLLALGRFEPLRDLLLRVFRNQNADGDWPQWFMFFDRERNIRPGDSHGDIVFWPVLALAQYLKATGDAGLLDEAVPFFHPEGDAKAEQASVRQHVERALAVMAQRVIPGTRLAAYGHGDWNDSLQPADPAMREKLCSAWTVTLHYQTLTTLAEALSSLGRGGEAGRFEAMAEDVLADFRRLLIVDGVVPGFAYFHEDGKIDYLLHPRDRTTGLRYSVLAMIHAIINGILTPEEARAHLDLIQQHLRGPDGTRLFDRPMPYRGGPQRYFQRAESSSFFGREIGLMYTHAHLRHAEALWRHGEAEAFYEALCKAVPIGLRELVAPAAPRQANLYYSSSDAAFRDRYQAYDEYEQALRGDIPLEGGWRVYSSGAGISMGLILRAFLGFRLEREVLVVDPVIPKPLDGLRAELDLAGRRFEVTYTVREAGFGPVAVQLNGADLPFARDGNPYRTGGALVPIEAFLGGAGEALNRLSVRLG